MKVASSFLIDNPSTRSRPTLSTDRQLSEFVDFQDKAIQAAADHGFLLVYL